MWVYIGVGVGVGAGAGVASAGAGAGAGVMSRPFAKLEPNYIYIYVTLYAGGYCFLLHDIHASYYYSTSPCFYAHTLLYITILIKLI